VTRWLITGAGGGLGSAVCRELLAAGDSVRGVDLRRPHPAEGLTSRDRFEFRVGDVRQSTLMREALQGTDALLHLAALTIRAASEDPLAALDVNTRSFLDLMEAAVGAEPCPVMVFSSTTTLHNPNPAFLLASTPEAISVTGRLRTPINLYAATKLFNELAAAHWRHQGLQVVAVRLGLVTFPWGGQGLSRQIVDNLVRRPLKGTPALVPCADDYPNWLSPGNAARACISAARAAIDGTAKECYDVVGQQRSMQEAIALARTMFPRVRIDGTPGVGGLDQRGVKSDLDELGINHPDSLEDQLHMLEAEIRAGGSAAVTGRTASNVRLQV